MFNTVFSAGIDAKSFILVMVAGAVLGIVMSLVFMYKNRHTSSFAIALALIPITVAIVIMMVNGNIGAGVAVAGAFALIRFRSIPGSAKEIAAIFIQMAIGISLGMGYIMVSAAFAVIAAVLVLVLTGINFGKMRCMNKVLKITLPENYDFDGLFDDIFKKYTKSAVLDKVKSTNMGTLYDLTYTVELLNDCKIKPFLDEIRTRNGNLNVSISSISEEQML